MANPGRTMHRSASFKRPVSRRLVTATLCALAVGLATLGVLAWAWNPPPPPPASFDWAASRAGDEGTYTWAPVQRGPDGPVALAPEEVSFAFRWLPNEVVRDADGALVGVSTVTIVEEGADPSTVPLPVTLLFDQDGSVMGERLPFIPSLSRAAMGSVPEPQDWNHIIYAPVSGIPWNPPCQLNAGAPGGALSFHKPLRLWSACRLGTVTLDELWVRPHARDVVGGRDALVLAATSTPHDPTPIETYVWVSPDVPYPLRVLRAEPGSPDRFTVYRLAEFVRGPPPTELEAPAGEPSPDLVLAPRRMWGPDEAGVDHPFSLSRAFALAREDATHPELRDFLAGRDAFVESAKYDETHRVESGLRFEDRTWKFTVTDGIHALFINIQQNRRSADNDNVPGGLPSAPVDTYGYGPGSFNELPDHATPSAPPPLELPAVASIFDRWRVYANEPYSSSNPNAWGFDLRCEAMCGAPAVVWAGLDRKEGGFWRVGDPSTSQVSLLTVDATGATLGLEERTATPTQPEAWSLDDEDRLDSSALTVPRLDHGAWAFPKSLYGSGAAFAAALAFFAYWFWPQLKAWASRAMAAFPLYSRIDRGGALTHPIRAQLVATIEQDPGIHFQELTRRLSLSQGVAQHHLGKLLQTGIVTARTTGGYTCYFAQGAVDRSLMNAAPLLKSKGARGLLVALEANPGASAQRLAAVMNVDPTTVHYHLRRMRDLALIQVERRGAELNVSLTDAGRRALQFVRRSTDSTA